MFNGYKRHLAAEPQTGLILAAELLPANLKEAIALGPLHDAIVEQGLNVGAYDFDRGYVSSELIPELSRSGIEVVSKPWTSNTEVVSQSETFASISATRR
ncbi:MAG: transposase [Rhodobacteraceae bacterium]|nr:transposase [Paracoccaceae bacterium]